MKRELKDLSNIYRYTFLYYCKAHPDEKGTESWSIWSIGPFGPFGPYCKAHPDEKGTERTRPF